MRRRSASLIYTLAALPWWAGLVFGAIGMTLIIYIPAMIWRGTVLEPTSAALRPVGYLWFALCCVVSIVRGARVLRPTKLPIGVDLGGLSEQQFSARLSQAFRDLGYSVANDEDIPAGVDLVLRRNGRTYFVHHGHRRASHVGVQTIQTLNECMRAHQVQGGFCISTGTFSTHARVLADDADIALIDGPALAKLFVGAPASANAQGAAEWPICPRCRGGMVRITNRGPNAPTEFWTCEQFDKCGGTREIAR